MPSLHSPAAHIAITAGAKYAAKRSLFSRNLSWVSIFYRSAECHCHSSCFFSAPFFCSFTFSPLTLLLIQLTMINAQINKGTKRHCKIKVNLFLLPTICQNNVFKHTVCTHHYDGDAPSYISNHSDGRLLFRDQHWKQKHTERETVRIAIFKLV